LRFGGEDHEIDNRDDRSLVIADAMVADAHVPLPTAQSGATARAGGRWGRNSRSSNARELASDQRRPIDVLDSVWIEEFVFRR
jgi:hypothetical protein